MGPSVCLVCAYLSFTQKVRVRFPYALLWFHMQPMSSCRAVIRSMMIESMQSWIHVLSCSWRYFRRIVQWWELDYDTVKMMFRLHPRRLIWTMCHIGNDGMLGRHVIGIIRFQSSTLWLSAWIQHELIKSRSDGMNTEIWPVIHVSCDRLLECRLCAFWRDVCMCSLNQRHRGGARRLGNGLQNCFKRVRLPSPRPINIIWYIIMKHRLTRIIALIMIDLTSLHSCDIIVLVMNDIIHSYVSNVDALDTYCAVAQLAVASDFESDGWRFESFLRSKISIIACLLSSRSSMEERFFDSELTIVRFNPGRLAIMLAMYAVWIQIYRMSRNPPPYPSDTGDISNLLTNQLA